MTPDTRRGQVQLVWTSGELKWEWMDRREKTVVDSVKVSESVGGTFERIETPHKEERIYLWTAGEKREMYWMQSQSDEGEDEIVAQVNQYLTSPVDAAPEGEAPPPASPSNQVDALSNILENLGMPPENTARGESQSARAAPAQPAAGGGSGAGGTLTLADLQGAMAGLATTTQPAANPATPLSEVVTPGSISALLEDEAAKNRLMEFLPENQRSIEHLEENLRSPQIQQTLRTLTLALSPDEMGSVEGYHSIIANFQLDPKDGEQALASGNPVQAFLDCVVASVEKEAKEEEGEEKAADESKDDDAMEE